MPSLPADLGPVAHGFFTTRVGGVSVSPWHSLNLSLTVGDRPEDVAANRALVADRVGALPVFLTQEHGNTVAVVTDDVDLCADLGPADAAVTKRSDIALGVLAADCVPVLLAEAERPIVGVAHVGRRGLVEQVLVAAVEAMAALGARPPFIKAAIGPAICGRCYEVGSHLRTQIDERVPGTASMTSWGTPAVDLPGGAARQLAALGVTSVHRLDLCTRTDSRFYSYRRDGATGRFAGIVRAHTHGPMAAMTDRDTPRWRYPQVSQSAELALPSKHVIRDGSVGGARDGERYAQDAGVSWPRCGSGGTR